MVKTSLRILLLLPVPEISACQTQNVLIYPMFIESIFKYI